jgi:GNAT superfamily N-acetyltransferase
MDFNLNKTHILDCNENHLKEKITFHIRIDTDVIIKFKYIPGEHVPLYSTPSMPVEEQEYIGNLLKPKKTAFVLYAMGKNKEVIGGMHIVESKVRNINYESCDEIDYVYVHSTMRKKGIGTTLLEICSFISNLRKKIYITIDLLQGYEASSIETLINFYIKRSFTNDSITNFKRPTSNSLESLFIECVESIINE